MYLISTFCFLPNIPPKRGVPLLTEAGAYCVKKQAVEIWLIKNSTLCYVKVRLPGLTLFRMEQKLWSSSAQVSWSLFKHLVASREDFKLNFLNWTSLCPIPSLHPNKTKQNQKNNKPECRLYRCVIHECPESQELQFPCALLFQPQVSWEKLVENSKAVNFDGMRFWRRRNLY